MQTKKTSFYTCLLGIKDLFGIMKYLNQINYTTKKPPFQVASLKLMRFKNRLQLVYHSANLIVKTFPSISTVAITLFMTNPPNEFLPLKLSCITISFPKSLNLVSI